MPSVRDQMAVAGTGNGSRRAVTISLRPPGEPVPSGGALEHRGRAGPLAVGTPGRAEADDLAYGVGVLVRQPPGQQAAEAPADDAHRQLVALVQLDEACLEPVEEPVGEPHVAAQAPAVWPVAETPEVAAEPGGEGVVGVEARAARARVGRRRPAGAG